MPPPDANETANDFLLREPLYAVLSEPRYRQRNLTAEAKREFFETGERYVSRVMALAERLTAGAIDRALEFGCGPGRVAIALARRCREVVAADVSDPVLHIARKFASENHAQSVRFVSVDELRGRDEVFDLVNCSLLLQRLDRDAGLAMLRDLLRRVKPGGVLALEFPFASRTSQVKGITRSLRRAVPLMNAAANVILGKKWDEPFMPATTYSIESVLRVLESARFRDAVVSLTEEPDLSTCVIVARAEPSAAPAVDAPQPVAAPEAGWIDARDIIAARSIEELNATAEVYFASLQDRTFQLAKPFSGLTETPAILLNLAVLLQCLHARPGQRVLDFGGGSGWLSRILTQLGLRAVVCDVSSTALEMAKETYERLPPIGDRPAPEFLHFDGRTLALPDASVDRIVCFDAFHHVPNPAEIIREFGRVLKPGGIAAFAEPGPEHSRSAQSQFEMRTYGVLESDVDVDAIWNAARASGFSELRLAVFNIPPFQVGLEAFRDMLAGGAAWVRWSDATRESLHNVRDFYLVKSGSEPLDSRDAAALKCNLEIGAVSRSSIAVTATNRGRGTWLPSSAGIGGVAIGCHLFDGSGALIRFDFARAPLDRACEPGDSVTVTLALGDIGSGARLVEVDCVSEGVSWFGPQGNRTVRVPIPA